MSPPSIVVDDFSVYSPFGGSTSLPIHSADNGSDSPSTSSPVINDHASHSTDDHTDPSGYDATNSSGYGYTDPSGYDHTDHSGSDLLTHPLLSSNVPTEVSSAVTSDSDLLHLPRLKSSKQTQQSGLLNFFSVAPEEDSYSMWRKRKRDHQERDEEEQAKIMCWEKKWKEEHAERLHKRNHLNQQKHQKKVKAEEIKAGVRNKEGKKLQVSLIFYFGESQVYWYTGDY